MTSCRAALALAAALAGCASVSMAPSRIHARRGPAYGEAVHRVVALPATCGWLGGGVWTQDMSSTALDSMSVDPCSQLAGIDSAVRAQLEFRGLEVIGSETINATTRSRHEREDRWSNGFGPESVTRKVELEGSRFADAPPAVQAALLRDVRADAVMNTRVRVGPGNGLTARRVVEVQLRLMSVKTGRMIWAKRCELEAAGLLTTDLQAIQRAAACAVSGVEP